MKYTELKNSIAAGAEKIYLLEGDDAYFRSNGEQLIKAAFLQMPELNYTSYDGENLKGQALSELSAAVKNYPFMAEKRIIKISEFYPSEADYEKFLKPLFEDFPETSILIVVNSGAKKSELKRKRSVTFVDCNHADRDTVAKWVYITLKRSGILAPTQVCESVADYCLTDMSRVSVETEKLIEYKKSGTLTQEDVDLLVFKDADYRLYELTNTVPRKDFNRFCLIENEILEKSGDEMFILNGLLNYFKTLSTIISSRESDYSLAEMLKMKEYGVKKSREQARFLGMAKITSCIKSIYSCISDIKSGIISAGYALQKAENFIFFSN